MPGLFDTSPATGLYAEVAPEQGIDLVDHGLSYAVPAELSDLAVGQRVTVPLGRGNRPTFAWVLDVSRRKPVSAVKTILRRDPEAPALTGELIELAKWLAEYYCTPLGMVLSAMIPAAVKRGTGAYLQTLVGLGHPNAAPENGRRDHAPAPVGGSTEGAPPAPPAPKLTKLQQAVLDAARTLAAAGRPWVPPRELADAAHARTIGPVRQLLARGLLAARQESTIRSDPIAEARALAGPDRIADAQLTPAQRRAIDRLAGTIDAGGFSVHLLQGVTGSGKTEVYLRAIERVLAVGGAAGAPPPAAPGGSAIILVPEIALTPQAVARFTARFRHVGVAVLHSALTAAQRHDQWRQVRDGAARIVVGARSAVFAPVGRLGLIVVDEEQETSYKADVLPRYHARDVAIKRAQLAGCPVVLGSATPSLESWHNAGGGGGSEGQGPGARGQGPRVEGPGADAEPEAEHPGPIRAAPRRPRYHLLQLPERVAGLTLPVVEIVDMADERRKRYQYTGSAGVHLLSLRLEAALKQTLAEGGQAMLLLNRRGFANFVSCPDHRCGWIMNCPDCDAAMVYHKEKSLPTGGLLRCHHCETELLLPRTCPVCGHKVTVFGLGTQRVEEELSRKFPAVTVQRMDSDAMRSGRDYHRVLERFAAGRFPVLLGTQMIAKGLDFPNVRLVGVISADTALHLPDFRSQERTFQLIAQVAGRAGRSDPTRKALVIVQTYSPRDPAIAHAARHDYEGFAAHELEVRRQAGLPPSTRLARIVVRQRDAVKARRIAARLMDALAGANAALGEPVRLRGPAPCPIARIGGFHRLQIEAIAPDAVTLQRVLGALRIAHALRSDATTAVDVDPVSLL